MKEYAGEEAGVGLHDIGNTLTKVWSALSVAKGYVEDSFITDTGEDLMSIVKGGEELGKKHNGYLALIMTEVEYDIDRHVGQTFRS